MSKVLFENRSNNIVRAVALKGNEKQATVKVINDFENLPYYWSELLLRHDSVCISVYGENLPATMMLSIFGFNGLMKLLDQDALKFHLQDSIITHSVTDIKGLEPLQSGKLNSSVHCDPEASVQEGLSRSNINISTEDKKKLIRRLSDSYVVPSKDHAPLAVKFTQEGYKLDRFKTIKFPFSKSLEELNSVEKKHLCQIAYEMHHLALISDMGMDSLDMHEVSIVAQNSFENINKASKVQNVTAKIFEIECLPSFQQLVKENVIPIRSLADHRTSSNCIKFRNWINSLADKNNTSEVTREYINAITTPGLFETKKARFIKTLCVSGLFGVIGGVVAGPIGIHAGGVAGIITEPFVGVGLDLIDEFLLGNILKGWNPKNYTDELRDKINKCSL